MHLKIEDWDLQDYIELTIEKKVCERERKRVSEKNKSKEHRSKKDCPLWYRTDVLYHYWLP